jgi:hypothetical protein
MSQATAQMRAFAARLIAHENSGTKLSGAPTTAAFPVVERLRPRLATLMGSAGFHALLSRALARAEAEVPSLRAVRINADGSLEGLSELELQVGPQEYAEARVVLLAQLLGLLEAFIGEGLTLRLAREVWPKLTFGNPESVRRQG